MDSLIQDFLHYYGTIRPSPRLRYSRLAVVAAWASPLPSEAWFLQFHAKACVQLTPPIRRLPFAQSSGSRRTCPSCIRRPWFRQLSVLFDASSEGLLTLVFWTPTYPRSNPGLLFRRLPPQLLTAAARTGLAPTPESQCRWAYHHLLRSFTLRLKFTWQTPFVRLQHTRTNAPLARSIYGESAPLSRGVQTLRKREFHRDRCANIFLAFD
jgi:hypothetical protein